MNRNANGNDKLKTEIEQLYEKRFQYKRCAHVAGCNEPWQLPPVEKAYSEFYQFDALQKLKERLNAVKSKLNNYTAEEWSRHTRRRDPAGEIPWRLKNETKAEFITVAWCKFFECLHSYPLVKESAELNSLHLCEAPGAFIAALNHYLFTTYDKEDVKWSWLATTLNPYYEGNPLNKMVIDERFILYTLDNWLFHADFTGNIIDRGNIENMEKECALRLGDVQLITADGSIDCADVPDCQEDYVGTLHLAEIVTALSILAEDGNFVVKMFTMFEASSVCLIYLFNCVFREVHVYKPATSKRGNSEVYVVCLGYRKSTATLTEFIELMKDRLITDKPTSLPLFSKFHLPNDFLLQHEICCRMFMNHQIRAIESNIYAFETKSRSYIKRTQQIRSEVSNFYYQRYAVQRLPQELCLINQKMGATGVGVKMLERIHKGSYSERKALRESYAELHNQIFRLFGEVNELEKTQTSCSVDLYHEDFDQSATKATLRVYKGAPVVKLTSSLFAAIPVLLMRLQLYDLFGADPIWQLKPKCVVDGTSTIRYEDSQPDDLPYYKEQQKFWTHVLKIIIEKKPGVIVFEHVPFLTHYSVSLLRVLSQNVFHHLKISVAPDFTISLETQQDGSETELMNLYELLNDSPSVHCILDIASLHRNNPFSDALIDFNNAVLLESFKRVLNSKTGQSPNGVKTNVVEGRFDLNVINS